MRAATHALSERLHGILMLCAVLYMEVAEMSYPFAPTILLCLKQAPLK
jgi:hypothetical protein